MTPGRREPPVARKKATPVPIENCGAWLRKAAERRDERTWRVGAVLQCFTAVEYAILVDDPHDVGDEIDQIEDTIEKFNTVLLSRLNDRKNGRVLAIAHRVNEGDLSAHLIGRRKCKHVALPLVATNDQTYKTTKGLWHRKRGQLSRPEAVSPEDLDELREDLLNPDFGMLYQQDIESQGLPAFTAAHFAAFSDKIPISGPVVLSVDAAMSGPPTERLQRHPGVALSGRVFLLARSIPRTDRLCRLA